MLENLYLFRLFTNIVIKCSMKSRVPRHNILRVSSISLPSGHDTHRFNTPGRVKCVHTCETAREHTFAYIHTFARSRTLSRIHSKFEAFITDKFLFAYRSITVYLYIIISLSSPLLRLLVSVPLSQY